jgi:hypothetical protein
MAVTTWMAMLQALVGEATMVEEGDSLRDTAASRGGAAAGVVDGVVVAVEAAAADAAAVAGVDWEAGHGLTEAGVLAAGDEAMQMI